MPSENRYILFEDKSCFAGKTGQETQAGVGPEKTRSKIDPTLPQVTSYCPRRPKVEASPANHEFSERVSSGKPKVFR